MGFLTKIEKFSGRNIEGFFRDKFTDYIQPAEIAKLLAREMRDNKNISVSAVYVPNKYTVFLGNEDWKTFDSVHISLSKELQEHMTQKARDKRYEMVGEVQVSFELDTALKLGTVSIESAFMEKSTELDYQEDSNPEKNKNQTIVVEKQNFYNGSPDIISEQDTMTRLNQGPVQATLVNKMGIKEGEKFPLGKRGLVIGRRKTNDICLEDENVSRAHAAIDYVAGNYYVTDLGSTNGTFVNGTRINKVKIKQGDLIKIGTIVLEFKVV